MMLFGGRERGGSFKTKKPRSKPGLKRSRCGSGGSEVAASIYTTHLYFRFSVGRALGHDLRDLLGAHLRYGKSQYAIGDEGPGLT